MESVIIIIDGNQSKEELVVAFQGQAMPMPGNSDITRIRSGALKGAPAIVTVAKRPEKESYFTSDQILPRWGKACTRLWREHALECLDLFNVKVKLQLDVSLQTIYRGAMHHVVALEVDGKSAAKDYLDEIERIQPTEFRKLSQRIAIVANTALLRNKEIFNNEGGGIWAFKTKGGKRLYAFFDENRLLIACFGADKPKKKQQQKDIGSAGKWKERYFQARENNQAIVIDGQTARR